MDCPNCKTYNPDERTVCWRCDKPLPKPVVKKKRQVSSQQWLYIIVGIMLLLMVAQMCGLPRLAAPAPQSGMIDRAPIAAQPSGNRGSL